MAAKLIRCEQDGFPILEINGEPHCIADFVDHCIGGQQITDIVQRNSTLYYVFESRHELPMLCYCCGYPLQYDDPQLIRQRMRGRTLQALG